MPFVNKTVSGNDLSTCLLGCARCDHELLLSELRYHFFSVAPMCYFISMRSVSAIAFTWIMTMFSCNAKMSLGYIVY